MTKRELGVHSEFAEDEIDIFQYLTQLGVHWKRIVLITVVVSVAFLYFSMEPFPSSSLELEIGFKNINIGEYPDGSVFSKNDLISDTIVEKTFSGLNELSSHGLSLNDYKDSFIVKPIYPIDIRLAKETLESGNGKLNPAEIVAYYDTVRAFVPSNYSVEFSPPVRVSEELKEKVFNKIVLEYSAYVKNNRFPDISMVKSLPKIDSGDLSMPTVFDQLYNYFISVQEIVVGMKAAEFKKMKITTLSDGEKKNQFKSDGYDKFTGFGFRFGSLGIIDNIRENLAALESIIFDEMAIKNVERYKRTQLALLKNVESMVEKLEKRANFRFRLAKLPTDMTKDLEKILLGTEVGTKDSGVIGQSPDRPSVVATSTLIGILLSYNSHYYSLMNEAEALFDQKVEMESMLKSVKDKLERIGSVSHPVGAKDELIKKAEGLAKTIHSQLREVAEELDKMVMDYFLKYESPIKKYFVLHGSSNTFYNKVILTIVIAFLASIILQIFLISFKQWKERKAAEKA